MNAEELVITTMFFVNDDFKIIGDSAGYELTFEDACIYIGKKLVSHVAIFINYNNKMQILKEIGLKTTNKRLLVTEEDPINRIVHKFNGKRADIAYAECLGVPLNKISDYFIAYPLGIDVEKSIDIISPFCVNHDGSMTFYSQILVNTFVNIMEFEDTNIKLSRMKNNIQIKPKIILSINCIAVSGRYLQENIWNSVNYTMQSFCQTHIVIVCYGEIYYKKYVNQTNTLLIIE
ncbi:hypothetical protein AN644_01380 [Candidatus Epulonipiscium fishelsonii]|nr:hypothetical protein AN644_01380 [Epulopiscium sp. SCG-C06WGA-EpuloA1]